MGRTLVFNLVEFQGATGPTILVENFLEWLIGKSVEPK